MIFRTYRSLFLPATLAIVLFSIPALRGQELSRLTLPEAPASHVDVLAFRSSYLQASSSQAEPAQAPMSEAERKKASEDQLQIQLHQRMAGVVPNFNAVLSGTALPLSGRQKIRASFRGAIDPYQFGLALVTSGYGQATDSHSSVDPNGFRHGYGQGAEGYGKRFGSSFADQFTGAIFGNGVFPALLHQDARYYRMGTGSFKRRFLYSLSTTAVCRGDNGKMQPNYSNLLGNLASGGISNLYYPAADRGFGLTIEQGLVVTAEGSFGALLIEFYPDIRKHIHGKRPPDVSSTSTHN